LIRRTVTRPTVCPSSTTGKAECRSHGSKSCRKRATVADAGPLAALPTAPADDLHEVDDPEDLEEAAPPADTWSMVATPFPQPGPHSRTSKILACGGARWVCSNRMPTTCPVTLSRSRWPNPDWTERSSLPSSCLWNIWPPVNPSALILAMAREQDKT
jgi:hypothetical protein